MNSTNHERQTLTSIQPTAGTSRVCVLFGFLGLGCYWGPHTSLIWCGPRTGRLAMLLSKQLVHDASLKKFYAFSIYQTLWPRLQTVVSSPDTTRRAGQEAFVEQLIAWRPSLRALSLSLSLSLARALSLSLPLSRSRSLSLSLSLARSPSLCLSLPSLSLSLSSPSLRERDRERGEREREGEREQERERTLNPHQTLTLTMLSSEFSGLNEHRISKTVSLSLQPLRQDLPRRDAAKVVDHRRDKDCIQSGSKSGYISDPLGIWGY